MMLSVAAACELADEIWCLVGQNRNAPRDARGQVVSMAGRRLIREAAGSLLGLEDSAMLVKDEYRRWTWPGEHLHASVAHCGPLYAVALGFHIRIGIDIQEPRDRPGALGWLGGQLGKPEGAAANIREFSETESLIKASELTKEGLSGLRLPRWWPGWRRLPDQPLALEQFSIASMPITDGTELALASDRQVGVRWWQQQRRGDKPQEVADPHLLFESMRSAFTARRQQNLVGLGRRAA